MQWCRTWDVSAARDWSGPVRDGGGKNRQVRGTGAAAEAEAPPPAGWWLEGGGLAARLRVQRTMTQARLRVQRRTMTKARLRVQRTMTQARLRVKCTMIKARLRMQRRTMTKARLRVQWRTMTQSRLRVQQAHTEGSIAQGGDNGAEAREATATAGEVTELLEEPGLEEILREVYERQTR